MKLWTTAFLVGSF